jgi:hypothetical protein
MIGMTNTTVLNYLEIEFAKDVGHWRQQSRELSGNKNAHGSKGGLEDHILGASGELAFAKITNRYPSGLFLPMEEDDDVNGIQVRTRRGRSYELYIWLNELDEQTEYALIHYWGNNEYCYKGSILGERAKDFYAAAWSKGNFPRESCYVVPLHELQVHRLDVVEKGCYNDRYEKIDIQGKTR